MSPIAITEREWIFELEKNQVKTFIISFDPATIPDATIEQCVRNVENMVKSYESLSLKSGIPAKLTNPSEAAKIIKSVFSAAVAKLDVIMSVDPSFDRFDIETSYSHANGFRFCGYKISGDCIPILRSSIKIKADTDVAPKAINKNSYKSDADGVRVYTALAVNWNLEFYEEKVMELVIPICVDKVFFVSAPFDEI